MTAMNRLYYGYCESNQWALLDERELSFGFVHSSKDKHKRGNCVLEFEKQ